MHNKSETLLSEVVEWLCLIKRTHYAYHTSVSPNIKSDFFRVLRFLIMTNNRVQIASQSIRYY